jgi:hypothetical protein
MADIEAKLTHAVYRITCPDSQDLGEFYLELLPAARRHQISQHLVDCPHCIRELAQLESFMSDLAPELEYSLADRLKIWVAKLLTAETRDGALGGTLAWAQRGETGGPLMYEAGEAQLTLEIQDDTQQPGHKSLVGLVLGVDTIAWQVHLWQNDRLLDAIPLDNLGNFIIENISSGAYKLILSGPGSEIQVPDLHV